MDFNSIFKVFLPKDRVFYQLFEDVAEHVHQMGIKLKEMVFLVIYKILPIWGLMLPTTYQI